MGWKEVLKTDIGEGKVKTSKTAAGICGPALPSNQCQQPANIIDYQVTCLQKSQSK